VWLKQLVRRLIREQRSEHGHRAIDPAAWLAVINKELIRSKFGCHLTCFVGIVDLNDRSMRYVLGGHLPLPILMTEQETHFLSGKGKPVGIFEDAEWEVFTVTLPQNAALVVFSDGVLEILPPGDLIAKEQYLLDLLRDTRGDVEQVSARLGLDGKVVAAPDDIAIMTIVMGELK
jgi:phosphoserine phosphatase RsbU/P